MPVALKPLPIAVATYMHAQNILVHTGNSISVHCFIIKVCDVLIPLYLFQESSYLADSSPGHDVGTGRLPELRLVTDALAQ